MAKLEKPKTNHKPKPRKSIYLSMVIGKDVEEILSHYEDEQKVEIAEHLIQTFDDLLEYFKTRSEDVYQKYAKRENELLKKFGKTFKPYTQKRIYTLFDFDRLLLEKNYFTADEFNSLKGDEGELCESDIKELSSSIQRMLHGALHFLYLEREPQFETKEKNIAGVKDEVDKEITEARQLLAIYYLLKSGFEISHRESNSISEVTRFAHLLTGTKFSTIQKSSIYKKFQYMPNYNKEEYLIKDLRFIRPYFEALHLQKVTELIDKEIEKSIRELPASRRKNFS